MKKLVLFTLLSLACISMSAQSVESKAATDTTIVYTEQWEYKTIYFDNTHANARQGNVEFKAHRDAENLNKLGKEGWELVAVTPIIAEPMGNDRIYTQMLVYTFKRRLQPKR